MELFLNTEKIDIACFTETWLKNNEFENIKIKGYRFCTAFNRSQFKNGGVAIFCKDKLLSHIKEIKILHKHCKEKIIEVCGIELVYAKNNIKIITMYRSPTADLNIFFEKLDSVLNCICTDPNYRIILCGDLNIDHLKSCNATNTLIDILDSFELNNNVKEATRSSNNSATSIDYMCTTYNFFENTCHVLPNALSDHTAQMLSFRMDNESDIDKKFIITRSLSQYNFQLFNSYISNESWQEVYNCTDVNKAYDLFINTFKHYVEVAFPLKKVNVNKTSNKSWVTKGIRISSEKLKYLYNMTINGNQNDKVIYNRYKKVYRRVIKAAKNLYNEQLYFRNNNKSKAVWNIINNTIKNRNDNRIEINEIQSDIGLIHNCKDIANHFNNFFVNAPNTLSNQLKEGEVVQDCSSNCNNMEYPTMFLRPVDEMFVSNIILNLKNSNSAGIDDISTNIIKSCKNYILKPLVYLINLSFLNGEFPEVLKTAKIIPIYKKGDKNYAENYRPIAILSTISKILEKAIYTNIYYFLEQHNILNSKQHGFRRGKSTTSAIYDFLEVLYQNLDNNKKTIGIFMDLSKAFDLVDHTLLINKIEVYGLRGNINKLLTSYLLGRKQLVEIQKVKSEELQISCGVPQGSVLGPLLFLLFVNDLPYIDEYNNLVMFADDNSYLCCENSIEEVINKARIMLSKFVKWFNSNLLFLNKTKTVFINFTPRMKTTNESYLIQNGGKSIEQVVETKFLGLFIDNSLSWEAHVDCLCKKLSSMCFLIYRLAQVSTKNVMLSYYYAGIYSRIKYGILFWGCSHHILRIFRLQKKAVRTIAGVSKFTTCRNIFREFNLLTVPCIYILEILLFVKQNMDKFVTNNSYHSYNTRKGANLCLPNHKLSIYEHNPTYLGIKLFNKLPENIKVLNNFRSFKSSVKQFLITNCFYSVDEYLEIR